MLNRIYLITRNVCGECGEAYGNETVTLAGENETIYKKTPM